LASVHVVLNAVVPDEVVTSKTGLPDMVTSVPPTLRSVMYTVQPV
jgi:hypothetical protein